MLIFIIKNNYNLNSKLINKAKRRLINYKNHKIIILIVYLFIYLISIVNFILLHFKVRHPGNKERINVLVEIFKVVLHELKTLTMTG